MKRISVVLLACLLFLTLAGAVYADDGRQGKFVMGGSYTWAPTRISMATW